MKHVKEQMTISISKALLDKVKDIVYWTPGTTLSGLVHDCFVNLVIAMENERGEPFPERGGVLRRGRPIQHDTLDERILKKWSPALEKLSKT